MTLNVTPGTGAALKSNLDGGEHVVVHAEDATQRTALLAALAALDPDVGLAAIVTALGGLATSAQLVTLLGQTDAVEGSLASILAKLIAAPSTEAKQDTIIGHVDGIEAALAAVLAKIIAAPATEAKQDALKASVDALLAATRPITGHFLVSPSGTALTNPTRRIVAGAAGTLTCTVGGTWVSYTVVAGQTLDVVATVISAAPAGTVGQF